MCVQRVANTFVKTKADLQAVFVRSRRVWLGITDPASPFGLVDDEAVNALAAWNEILSSASFCISMRAPESLPIRATADAMASEDVAGLGGVAHFATGDSIWFQFRLSLADAQLLWPWVGSSMQKHIAAWKLLAHFALTFAIESHLPLNRFPVRLHQGCDNSAADAVTANGISMTAGMYVPHLTEYFIFMRRHQITAEVSHIPDHLNEVADALSRFQPPSIDLDVDAQVHIDVKSLMNQAGIHVTQSAAKWPKTFRIR